MAKNLEEQYNFFFFEIFQGLSSILSLIILKMQNGISWCFLIMAVLVGHLKFEKM